MVEHSVPYFNVVVVLCRAIAVAIVLTASSLLLKPGKAASSSWLDWLQQTSSFVGHVCGTHGVGSVRR